MKDFTEEEKNNIRSNLVNFLYLPIMRDEYSSDFLVLKQYNDVFDMDSLGFYVVKKLQKIMSDAKSEDYFLQKIAGWGEQCYTRKRLFYDALSLLIDLMRN